MHMRKIVQGPLLWPLDFLRRRLCTSHENAERREQWRRERAGIKMFNSQCSIVNRSRYTDTYYLFTIPLFFFSSIRIFLFSNANCPFLIARRSPLCSACSL